MKIKLKKNISVWCIAFIVFTWVYAFFNNELWRSRQVVWDVIHYYEYLPAAIIHHDLTFKFIDKNPAAFTNQMWLLPAPNGGKVSKTTMGMSFLYLPFFLTGHLAAKIFNEPQTGFTLPYQCASIVGCLFYLALGFFFLRKFLLFYFTDSIVSIVLLSIYFGTNLFYYTLFEALMPHAYIFSLVCLLLYSTTRWRQNTTYALSIITGILCGLLVLIRPTLIILLIIPLMYGVYNKKTFVNNISFLFSEKKKLLTASLFLFLILIPQLIYWKINTGQWIYYSYPGERFYFSNPHFIDGLFSYRKGWLLYTPVMALSLMGFLFLYNQVKEFFFPLMIVFLFSFFLIVSWWAWWFGGTFGNRAFIDLYSVLALPLGAFFKYFSEKPLIRYPIFQITFLLIALNLFQTWQYKRGIIHFDAMTKKAYWASFGKLEHPSGWWKMLKSPDYDKALRGEDEN